MHRSRGYLNIGERDSLLPQDNSSRLLWVIIIIVGAAAIASVVLGGVAVSRLENGFYSPSGSFGSLTVGGNPITKRGAGKREESAMSLTVNGETAISGNLIVSGEVMRAAAPPDCSGTTLNASKTATPHRTKYIFYDWSVSKTLTSSDNITVERDQCATSWYTVNAQRTMASMYLRYSVAGGVTVTNGGAVPTVNLKIRDVVQVMSACTSGPFVDAFPDSITTPLFPVDTSAHPVLAPGETFTYAYDLDLSLIPGFNPACIYKNTARVTIENHSGCLPGCPQCPGPLPCPCGPAQNGGGVKSGEFSIPSDPDSTVEYNETAKLSDFATSSNANLVCNSLPSGSIDIPTPDVCTFNATSGLATCTVGVECCNTGVECDTFSTVSNYVQLMTVNETFPLVRNSNLATLVNVYSGACPAGGCTLTIGYWKTHAGFTGNNADRVTQYLPLLLGCPPPQYANGANVTSASQAQFILTFNLLSGGAADGLNKVAAQLLAARLNVANGAPAPASVTNAINAGMAYLCTRGFNPGTWSSLSNAIKQGINANAAELDSYNNGLVAGAPHCQ